MTDDRNFTFERLTAEAKHRGQVAAERAQRAQAMIEWQTKRIVDGDYTSTQDPQFAVEILGALTAMRDLHKAEIARAREDLKLLSELSAPLGLGGRAQEAHGTHVVQLSIFARDRHRFPGTRG
jgi:hypothetical protein